jgi:NAD(P)-dependent dehydrogenase (short-subunit alcohol dehydrogenase family)
MESGHRDRVVIVTGGTHGIGAACVRAFAAAGAKVVICGRDTTAGKALADELTAAGGSCHFERCDVSDVEQIRAVVESTVVRHGRLDCLVNNAAGFTGFKTIDELEVDQLIGLLQVNFVAYFAAAKFALPHLRQTRGAIVNINSIVGKIGGWHDSAYAATKGAGIAFTKSLAIDEAAGGVRVNGVLPGNVMTENRFKVENALRDPAAFHDYVEATQWIGRSAEPEEIAAVVLFLASEAASFITGANIPVTGASELGIGLRTGLPSD